MPYHGKLKGQAVQTATANALENEIKQYLFYNQRVQKHQSIRAAFMARKHLQKMKALIHKRKLELLALYSSDEKRIKEYYNDIFTGGK